MKQEIRTEWTGALRSGEYAQGTQVLRSLSDEFCCLGVLCDLAVKAGVIPEPRENANGRSYVYGSGGHDTEEETTVLPQSVMDWAGCGQNPIIAMDRRSATLAELNDYDAMSLSEIADVIEEYL